MERAKRSIKVFSPYLSKSLLELLIAKAETGLAVELITTSEAENDTFYRMLVKQHRTTIEREKTKRRRGRTISTFCGIALFLLFALSFKYNFPSLEIKDYTVHSRWLLLIGSFVCKLIHGHFSKIRIYEYSYAPTLNFSVIVSPNTRGADSDAYFTHAKYYIIDENEAFIGSLNFTYSGLRKNYESCIKIEKKNDADAIVKLMEEFDWMRDNDRTMYRSVALVGPKIYSEPPN
jgi:phosphatidylserine/phosphatidylglycerophosphate/cardiolipin synthase-like enzyme